MFTSASVSALFPTPSLDSSWQVSQSFQSTNAMQNILNGAWDDRVGERCIPCRGASCGLSPHSQQILAAEVDAIQNNQSSRITDIVSLSSSVNSAEAQNTMTRLADLTLPVPKPQLPLSGTCRWLFNEERYSDWAYSRTARRLVIYGGAGKRTT